jgi:FixJ family two-component response regulator
MKPHAELSEQRPLVIVVDDDRAVRNSLKFSLEIEGFAVRTYSDSNELLNDSELAASSCLLIDQNLPGMSGLEAIAKLRERHVFTPAILITSHPRAAVTERAAKAAVPIVEKPFLESGLLEQIRAVLGRRGHHD